MGSKLSLSAGVVKRTKLPIVTMKMAQPRKMRVNHFTTFDKTRL